ncbi:MAG: guanylate kinase [Dehalococcoidia bacterium]|nr:guanylate kinase [Dehalococcoidia bacterium]
MEQGKSGPTAELPLPVRGPLLILISGPSGVGKDALIRLMREGEGAGRRYVVTATTRPQRQGEIDGVDYHFVGSMEFEAMRDRGELQEWAEVYGYYYGVPAAEVDRGFNQGRDVVIKTDVQGAATIKQKMPHGVFIFLAPSSKEELLARLWRRSSESGDDLKRRIDTFHIEMEQLHLFDYVVVNREGCLDQALRQVEATITAEKCRVVPREVA